MYDTKSFCCDQTEFNIWLHKKEVLMTLWPMEQNKLTWVIVSQFNTFTGVTSGPSPCTNTCRVWHHKRTCQPNVGNTYLLKTQTHTKLSGWFPLIHMDQQDWESMCTDQHRVLHVIPQQSRIVQGVFGFLHLGVHRTLLDLVLQGLEQFV